MKAIVYTSNTGSTAQYAKLLAHEVKLPVYSLEEARKYLKISSNRTVKVITGYAIINENKIINSYAVTKVKFNKISEEDIDYYLENEKDALYVSGFVIEGMMSNDINKINGSFYNILGVPVEEIYKNLKKMGYNLNMFKKS